MAVLILAMLLQVTDPVARDRDFWQDQQRQQLSRDQSLATQAQRQREATTGVLTRPSSGAQAEQRWIDEARRRLADEAAAEANRRGAELQRSPHLP